jgi:NADH:ubiquinone oxidoreductase subunit 4 (subunit M)
VGIIYTSFTAIRQTDFKVITHLFVDLVILGILVFNTVGLEGE